MTEAESDAAPTAPQQPPPHPVPTTTPPTEPANPIITDTTSTTTPQPYLVHIRPLSRSVTAAHLRDIFSHFGDVSVAAVPLDSTVQLPLGYGVVGMEREEEAQTAVECMNGGWIDGQLVTVTRRAAAKTASNEQRQTSEPTTPHSHSHHSIDHSPPSTRRDSYTDLDRDGDKGRSHRDDHRRHSTDKRDERRRSRSPKRRRSWVDYGEQGGDRGRGRERDRRGGYPHRRSSCSRSRSPLARSGGQSDSRSRSRSRSSSRERHKRRR